MRLQARPDDLVWYMIVLEGSEHDLLAYGGGWETTTHPGLGSEATARAPRCQLA